MASPIDRYVIGAFGPVTLTEQKLDIVNRVGTSYGPWDYMVKVKLLS
jgi:hypothetical protein